MMRKVYLKIKPMDTLFFRTGKPFSGGEVSWTTSNPFPAPSVLWGAVYSMLLGHGQIKEPEKELDKLRLGQVFLLDGKSLYLPTPRDLYKVKGTNKIQVLQLEKTNKALLSSKGASKSIDNRYQLVVSNENIEAEGIEQHLIEYNTLLEENYLSQIENENLGVEPISYFLKSNPKVGIKRDAKTRLNEEGMLYRIDSAEYCKDTSFLLVLEVADCIVFPTSGYLKLGGESKVATFEVIDSSKRFIKKIGASLEKVSQGFGTINRVLITAPTYFPDGNGITKFHENGLIVQAASIGKPIKVGGFDVANRCPKSMKNYVPSGSVYFIEEMSNHGELSLAQKVQNTISPKANGFNQYLILPTSI